jgi:hypothetical protein
MAHVTSTFDPKPLLIGCSEEEGEFHIMDNGKPICGCRIDDLDTTMGTVEDVECEDCINLAPQTAVKWADEKMVMKHVKPKRRLFGDPDKEYLLRTGRRPKDEEPDYYNPMDA